MQKDRNLFNQDFKAELAWTVSSGHKESRSGAFLDFKQLEGIGNVFWRKISRDTFVRWCWNPQVRTPFELQVWVNCALLFVCSIFSNCEAI